MSPANEAMNARASQFTALNEELFSHAADWRLVENPRFRTFSDSLYARARAEWELGTLADG